MRLGAAAQRGPQISLGSWEVGRVFSPLSKALTPLLRGLHLSPCMAQLPVMAGEFLLLMVFLDKFWFTPVGEVLDKRDLEIRTKLGSVKDNTGDVEKFAADAAEILKIARQETSKMVNEKKSAKQSELDAVYASAKAKVTSETDAAIAVLEKESQSMLRQLDTQVRAREEDWAGGMEVDRPKEEAEGSGSHGLGSACAGLMRNQGGVGDRK
jgi:F0F1-type ATP synthase membrane subunit b/b'